MPMRLLGGEIINQVHVNNMAANCSGRGEHFGAKT
jgi:hypothetical protein